MVALGTDPRKIANAARVLLNEMELEGSIDPRLLQAVQFLIVAVEELAESQKRFCTSSPPIAGR